MAEFTTEGKRFRGLMGLGNFLNGVGVLMIGGSFLMGFRGWMQYELTKQLLGMDNFWIPGAIMAFFFGLILSAIGQLVSCFVSIENNTHATMQVQQTMLQRRQPTETIP